jgi:hypothetical protein
MGGFETDPRKAEKLCSKYTPEEIAKAGALVNDGITDAFSRLLREVSKFDDAQIECARAAWHSDRDAGRNKAFSVREDCKR